MLRAIRGSFPEKRRPEGGPQPIVNRWIAFQQIQSGCQTSDTMDENTHVQLWPPGQHIPRRHARTRQQVIEHSIKEAAEIDVGRRGPGSCGAGGSTSRPECGRQNSGGRAAGSTRRASCRRLPRGLGDRIDHVPSHMGRTEGWPGPSSARPRIAATGSAAAIGRRSARHQDQGIGMFAVVRINLRRNRLRGSNPAGRRCRHPQENRAARQTSPGQPRHNAPWRWRGQRRAGSSERPARHISTPRASGSTTGPPGRSRWQSLGQLGRRSLLQ